MDLILHMATYWLLANLAVVSYLIFVYSKQRVADRLVTGGHRLKLISSAGGKGVRAHQNVESGR